MTATEIKNIAIEKSKTYIEEYIKSRAEIGDFSYSYNGAIPQKEVLAYFLSLGYNIDITVSEKCTIFSWENPEGILTHRKRIVDKKEEINVEDLE